jgi:hypothetical protein
MKRTILLVAGLLLLVQGSLLSQGKLSGLVFGDYYYNFARDGKYGTGLFANSTTPASNGSAPGNTAMQAFQIRRVYFTYDDDISEQFTTRFRLEADQGTDLLGSGKISTYVKDAYLKWKNIFSGSDLIFGIQPTTAYDISESAWGYRSLEKTIMDLRGIVSSRDQGIALRGKLTGDGMFNYWVMIANQSANAPASTVTSVGKLKRYSALLQAKPVTNLQVTINVDYQDKANRLGVHGDSLNNAVLVGSLFVGYANPFQYSFGLEAFLKSQSNQYTPPGGSLGSQSGMGISVWGSYFVQPDLAVVLRYDNYDPNTNSNAKGDLQNYIIAGLDWKVNKNVSVMPNVLYETYEAPTGATTPNASVTARVTFYWIFL